MDLFSTSKLSEKSLGNLAFAGSLFLHIGLFTLFSFWPGASELPQKTQPRVVHVQFLPAPTAQKETQNPATKKTAHVSPAQPLSFPTPSIPTLTARTPQSSTPDFRPASWSKKTMTFQKAQYKPRTIQRISHSQTAKPARSTQTNQKIQRSIKTIGVRPLPALNPSPIQSAQPMQTTSVRNSGQTTIVRPKYPTQEPSTSIAPTLHSKVARSLESSERNVPNIRQRPNPASSQSHVSTGPSKTARQVAQSFTVSFKSKTRIAALPQKPIQNTSPVRGDLDANLTAVRGLFTGKVRQQIAEAKHYPRIARRREMEGQPIVSFTLSKEGGILKAALSQTSGYRLLDKAALEAVQKAAPYPKIPDELQTNTYQFKLPISFTIK